MVTNKISNNDLNLEYVIDLHKTMQKHNFMLSYRGAFSQDMVKSIISLTEKRINEEEHNTAIKKRVFNVMVECLQNICNTNIEQNKSNSKSLFMFGKNEDEYRVYSGSVIENDKVDSLKSKLESIKHMSSDELKNLYVTLLSTSKFIDNLGIALGLIDVAKKTGNKISFSFSKMNEEETFFSLSTSISKQIN
jgi:hypothetical protein